MDALISEVYKGYRILIKQDEDPIHPRKCCGCLTGVMVCGHNRYDLGDEHAVSLDDHNNWDEVEAWLRRVKRALVILPIYMYDHSGITISTEHVYPYTDRWDAGRLGLIYANKGTIRKGMGSMPRSSHG